MRRLKRKKRIRLSDKQKAVKELAEKQDWNCCYCGHKMFPIPRGQARKRNSATLEHIVLRTQGGRNLWPNMKAACSQCNGLRGSTSYAVFRSVMNTVKQIPQIMDNWHTSSDHKFTVIRHEILTRIRLVEARYADSEFQEAVEHELNAQILARQKTFNPGR